MPLVDDKFSHPNSLPCAVKKYFKILQKTQSIADVSLEQLQLTFQLWVAYDLYGHRKEVFTGQLKCPLIGCSKNFESLGLCLQHLTNCKWLPNAWYWCPHCERPERFAEPQSTLINRSKVGPPPEIHDRIALPPQKSTIAKITTTRFWKHMRNKSRLLSPHPMSTMFRPSRSVDLVPPSGQSLSEFEFGFVWNPNAPYDARFAIAPSEENIALAQSPGTEYRPYRLDGHTLLMQPPELEATPNDLSDDPWLNQRSELPSPFYNQNIPAASTQPLELDSEPYGLRHFTSSGQPPELESPPTYQLSELQGAQPYTERSSKTLKATELPGDGLHRGQQPELDGSTPSYIKTQQAWPLNKHSSTTDCLQPLSSWDSVQTSFITGALLAEPPPSCVAGVAQSGSPSHSLDILARRLTFPHYGGPIGLSIDSTSIQQSTPFGQFAYQESQDMDSAPMPPRNDHCQELANTDVDVVEDHVGTAGILGSVEAPDQIFYPAYTICQEARSGNIHQQENYPSVRSTPNPPQPGKDSSYGTGIA
ncbi:MAG: hypothetical protein Q9209_000109 [Squamulea sp. 1 TL-2023]